jgi:hypothetical protein
MYNGPGDEDWKVIQKVVALLRGLEEKLGEA